MGVKSLLSLVQEFTDRNGLPTPGAVIGTTDPGVKQYRGILNELCDDFVARAAWQYNVREALWTTVNAEVQGGMKTIVGEDFKGIVPDTIYDRTQKLKLNWITQAQYQARKAAGTTGPWTEVFLRANALYGYPAPTAGRTWAFNYYSTYFVTDAEAGVPKRYWTLDTDLWFSDDSIPMAWLAWRWLYRKGLDYTEEFQSYERLVASFASSDQPKGSAKLDDSHELRPHTGILVPIGNWPLP